MASWREPGKSGGSESSQRAGGVINRRLAWLGPTDRDP